MQKTTIDMEEKYIAAIDLGTHKLGLAVARVQGDNVQVVYYKETPSDGIKGSNVLNPMKATVPLQKAIQDAEKELMIKILQVVVGLPRYSVLQETANGGVVRTDPDEYVTREEVENLKAMAIDDYPLENPATQVMFGAVAQSFSTDEEIQYVEDDIIGTMSSSLEGNFRVFIGKRKATTAIDKIFSNLGIALAKKYFLPDVVAGAVLREDEKQNGVALVDFGAGVTSVSVYHGGIMRYYGSIPFGGKTISNDIRIECSISDALAENIKLAYGGCMPSRLSTLGEKTIQIRYDDGRVKEIPVRYLSEIIDARAREIIDAILFHIQESGYQQQLRSGIVLTGGAASLLNFGNLLKDISGYNVTIGYPRHLFSVAGCIGVYDPSATSAIGMILAAKNDNLPDCVLAPEIKPEEPAEKESDTPEEDPVSDEQLAKGQLIDPEAFGEKVEVETKPKRRREPKMTWKKLGEGIGNVFVNLNKVLTDDSNM